MALLDSLMWILSARSTVLLCVSLFLALLWLLRKPRNTPPGPWGMPIIGSVPAFLWGLHKGLQPYHLFERYARSYGPVFQLRLLNKTVVVLNDYGSMRTAFQNPQLNNRPAMLLTEIFNSEGVAMASGEPWTELRRFCLTVLRSFGVGKSSFEEKIGTEAEELMKEIDNLHGKPFKPKPFFDNAVANVICAVIFGKRYEYSDREFGELLSLLSRNIKSFGAGGALNFFPSLRHLPFLGIEDVVINVNKFAEFIRNVINTHRATFDANNLRDLTDVFLMEIQENLGTAESGALTNGASHKLASRRHLSERNLVGTIANLFAAGSETTSTTLQWCLYYMIVYPDIQKRVQAEIDAVVGRNRLPRLADKPELNFTQAVIWEVQRLGAVTPLGVPHTAASDTKLQGFEVPQGAFLVANLWAVFHDPNLWPEPDQFKPDRFLNDEGKAVKPEEFIPFSTGRRSCIGEHLAKMELYVFFSYFMHQFAFKEPDNSPPLSLKGEGGIFHFPRPMNICASRRD